MVMVELCDVDRCWVSSESAVAGFADGFTEARCERGVREDGSVMMVVVMTILKRFALFQTLQWTAG